MSIFGVTAADVQNKIVWNPGNSEFTIGPSGEMSEAACSGLIEIHEQRILSWMPDKYRSMLTNIDGEILTYSADPDVSSYTVSLTPVVSGTLGVYVNYPENSRSWERRNYKDLTTLSYSFSYNTGQLEISLNQGDVLWVEYEHTAAASNAGFSWLRDHIATLTAVDISRRFWFVRDAEQLQRFNLMEMTVIKDMERLNKPKESRGMGIAILDDIEMINNDTNRSRNIYSKILRY